MTSCSLQPPEAAKHIKVSSNINYCITACFVKTPYSNIYPLYPQSITFKEFLLALSRHHRGIQVHFYIAEIHVIYRSRSFSEKCDQKCSVKQILFNIILHYKTEPLDQKLVAPEFLEKCIKYCWKM